ncbi:MAG TPA: DUF1735 domain-containing protein [Arachidicoccus soli]|nr:DUF1735 domain-containing protein [Arachidicoccus soli]
MNKRIFIITISALCLGLVIFVGCKQDFIQGVKTVETGKVYFPGADSITGGVIPVVNNYVIDTSANAIGFPVKIYRGGFSDNTNFTVNVSVDNSAISGLMQSGKLPTNTVALSPDDYILNQTDTISLSSGGTMTGEITPLVKNSSLEKYSGKVVALGLTISGSSKFDVNAEMNKVVIYFPVDSLLGQIYFTNAGQNNNLVSVIKNYVFDSAAHTVNFSLPIARAGVADMSTFTANLSVDNSAIAGLVNNGNLPANTVALSPGDYTLNQNINLTVSNGMLMGIAMPKINVASIEQYSGKVAALGITITSSSKYTINPERSTVIIYFNVDDILNIVAPRVNLLDFSKWTPVKLSIPTTVTATINPSDNSIWFQGGTGGYDQAGVYQAIQVKANLPYKVDMNVEGSGANNVWFEIWISSKQPVDGQDVTASWDPTAKTLLGINTWNGCGKSAFNGLLSQIQCEVKVGQGTITFPTSGTYYITIKSGGNDLGTTGIKATNIYFK